MSTSLPVRWPGCNRSGRIFPVFLAAFALAGCTTLPPGGPGSRIDVPSPNADARRPNFVILHHTGSANVERALATLTDPERKVSAHYLIGRDGTVYRLVDEARRAWHAGASSWGGQTDLNSASVGIELDNAGNEPFPPVQIEALKVLLGEILPRHRIPAANVVGHGDVAPGRKADPSHHFPWRDLARAGYGLWCEPESDNSAPPALDGHLALRALGYDTTDPLAAVAAFRRHHLGDEADVLGDDGLRRLDCLLRQPRADP